MADRVETATVVVPAGTLPTAPITVDMSFSPGDVSEVEIVVPSGHAGLTRLQIAQGGSPVIPATSGATIVADGEVIRWPLDGYLNNGDWQAIASNVDVFDHTFYVRFLVSETTSTPPAPQLPVSVSAS